MTHLATLPVLAYSASAVVISLFVIFVLIGLGLWFSVWYYRKRLELRKSLIRNRREVKKCPTCNTVMDLDVNYCPNCGTEVPTVTTITP